MIRYESSSSGGLTVYSIRGTIPADRMRTLSSQPFVILNAGDIAADKYLVPLSASANMVYTPPNGLTFPMNLTWDQALNPFIQLAPYVAGGGMVTGVLMVWSSNFETEFTVNNINLAVKPDLVWKSIADSPAADFQDVPYEVLYYLRDVLTV